MASSSSAASSSAFSSSATYLQGPAIACALTPDEVRGKLVEYGVIPSAHEAREKFLALGKDWWRFIIDGRCHKYGSEVFDLGLHGGSKEPGYLEGVRKGCEVFLRDIDRDLSEELYAEIHLQACKHFKKNQGDGTLCDGSIVHRYRENSETCSVGVEQMGLSTLDQLQKAFSVIEHASISLIGIESSKKWDPSTWSDYDREKVEKVMKTYFPDSTGPVSAKDMVSKLKEDSAAAYTKLGHACHEYLEKVRLGMKAMQERLALRYGIVHIYADYNIHRVTLKVSYDDSMRIPNFYKDVTVKLIQHFNDDLHALQSKTYLQIETEGVGKIEEIKTAYREAALRLIARLYAELDWAHPWIDGQGRTDLIVLNGLLTREGMHPCFLHEPYYSTFNTVEDWIVYLKAGLADYEEFMLTRVDLPSHLESLNLV